MHHILYLHGFLSSPESAKSQLLRTALVQCGAEAYWHAPTLPLDPAQAQAMINEIISGFNGAPVLLVGSSLGGFYATVAAERWQAPAIVINPAVRPYDDLRYIGWHTHYRTGERVEVTQVFMTELAALDPEHIDPARYWLLASEDDGILDYRAALVRYAGAEQTVLPDGGHVFSHFSVFIPDVLTRAEI